MKTKNITVKIARLWVEVWTLDFLCTKLLQCSVREK